MSVNTEALMKVCCRCKLPKPATRSYFHRSAKTKDQLDPRCRGCRRAERPGAHLRAAALDIRPREERLADTHKHCLACKYRKPLEEFPANRKGFAGRLAYCYACASDRNNAYLKKRRAESWESRLLSNARVAHWGGGVRSRKKRVQTWAPMDIDAAYLQELLQDQDGCCGWTGIRFSLKEIGKPWSVSLDRLDCAKGYVKGNVMLVCVAANLARNNSTPDDMLAFVKMIKEA